MPVVDAPLSRHARRAAGRHRAFVLLVAGDAASKQAAWHLLPGGSAVEAAPGLRFYLALNEWGVLGGAEGLDAVTAHPAYTLLLAVGLFAFAAGVVVLGRSRLAGGARLGAGAALFALVAWLAEAASPLVGAVDLDAEGLVTTIRASVLAVTLSLYAAARRPWPRAVTTFLAAGAASNALSLVVPPFEVVDFLVVPLAPLLSLAGSPAPPSGDEFGVVNLADLYLAAALPLALAWGAAATARGGRLGLLALGRLATKQGRG